MAEQQDDYSALPLEERAAHKIWKVRLGAYEEMKGIFAKSGHESDPCFDLFVNNPSIFKKIVTDSNVAAQEAGVAALAALLEFGGPQACLKLRSQVIGPLVEKTMGSMRAGTKQSATESLLLFIEMDMAEPVIEEIIPVLKHKTPKVVAGTTNALTTIVHQYGAKTVPCKLIFQALPGLFAHTDKTVRAAAQALSIELYRWLGDSFKNVLFPDLKPVQQKDLDAEFENVKNDSPKQERYLRSQKEAMNRQQANGISVGDDTISAEDDEDMDMEMEMDLFDPVEVLSKVPPSFSTQVTSSKWKERKEALEELHTILNHPKLEDGDYSDLMRTLAKCMKDANIQVVALAANSIESVAKGLKTNFYKYQPIVLSPMLERLKEKKQSVADALNNALDAVYQCTSLSDILEETLEFLKHKTPQVKIETSKFVSRCLSTTKTMPSSTEIKSIIEHSIKLLSDTQEPVRSGGAQILGVVMKLVGERAMNPFLESVDDIKKGKIKEWYEKSEVKAKPGKAARAPQASAPPSSAQPASAARGVTSARGGPMSAAARGGLALRKRVPPGGAAAAVFNSRTKAEEAAKSTVTGSPMAKPAGTFGAHRPGLSSSAKPAARPFGGAEPMEEVEHSPQSSSVGLSQGVNGRGLTGRALAAQGKTVPPPVDSGLTAQERQELKKLRQENQDLQKQKEQLNWQIQGFNSEKTHLLAEINSLKEKNAKLMDEHTHGVLAIKSRETQLTRSQTDLETARLRINQLEQEVENMRHQLTQERGQSRVSQVHASSNINNTSNSPAHRQTNSISTGRFANNYSAGMRSSPQRPTSLYGTPRRDWQQQHAQATPQRGHQTPGTPVDQTSNFNRSENDGDTGYGSPVGVGEDTIMDGAEELEEASFAYESQTPIAAVALGSGDKRSSIFGASGLASRQYFSNPSMVGNDVNTSGLNSPSHVPGARNGVAANRSSRLSTYRSSVASGGLNDSHSIRSQSSMAMSDTNSFGARTAYGSNHMFDSGSSNDGYGHANAGESHRTSSRIGDYNGLRYPATSSSDQWQKTSQIAESLKQRIEFLKKRAETSKQQFDSDSRQNR